MQIRKRVVKNLLKIKFLIKLKKKVLKKRIIFVYLKNIRSFVSFTKELIYRDRTRGSFKYYLKMKNVFVMKMIYFYTCKFILELLLLKKYPT